MTAAAEDTILYSVADRIATITFNRPDRMNAMLPDMGPLYSELLDRADADPEVRVIIVTGAGRGFCAGADLSVLAEGMEALNRYVDGMDETTLPIKTFSLSKPVITAINGACAGIGFVQAICADLRIASPKVNMGTTFARLGLVGEYGIAWLLPRLLGHSAAAEILLTGRMFTADEALRLGIINEIAEDPYARAVEIATDIAANVSPYSVAILKGQILRGPDQTMAEGVADALAGMRASFLEPDLAEALDAKTNKRQVEFPPAR